MYVDEVTWRSPYQAHTLLFCSLLDLLDNSIYSNNAHLVPILYLQIKKCWKVQNSRSVAIFG